MPYTPKQYAYLSIHEPQVIENYKAELKGKAKPKKKRKSRLGGGSVEHSMKALR